MKTITNVRKRVAFALVLLGVGGAGLTGCGGMNSAATVPVAATGSTLHGKVYGGQQPIVGATLQLYAAGSTGYGSAYTYAAGTSLLGTQVVQTGAGGSFSITGDYVCPSPTTEVYLVATGGSPTLSGPVNNSIALMAALGPCGLLSASTNVSLNEITTVGSVWALSPFMTGIANIGTSSTNAQGLTNAFATVNKLVNIATGGAGGPALPAGASVSVAKIDTLADILALCINSAGDTGTGTPCDLLFNAATVNGVKPADTLTAAMNLAHLPNLGTSLASMVDPTAPFQPALTSVPNDFSLAISYTGGGISTPTGIAADPAGNVWVANAGSNSVTKMDALGVTTTDGTGFLSGASGYTTGPLNAPTSIAIDQSGFAWVANGGNNTVVRLSADGAASTTFQGGGLSGPSSVSIDPGGNAWVANRSGASVTLINTSGSLLNFTGGGIASPSAIAINPK